MKNSTALVVSSYDFNVGEVFKRCDKIGAIKFKLSFHEEMSTQKVLKVLLYREGQFLEKAIRDLLEGEPKATKKLKKRVKKICYLLTLCGTMFDPAILLYCINHFVAFYKKDKKTVLPFVQSTVFQRFLFDFECFLSDENSFYLLPHNDIPLKSFIKYLRKNNDEKLAKTLKKTLL